MSAQAPGAEGAATLLRFAPDVLEGVCRELFVSAGSPGPEAALLAHALIGANLAGHDSHGVQRIPHWLKLAREGKLVPGQQAAILADHGAVARFTGHWGYGAVIATQAVDEAIGRAGRHGVGAVGVSELNHLGRPADYVRRAAAAGCIGLAFVAGGGYYKGVAPFGGAEARFDTNPIAAAFPSRREAPLVMDFATSAVAAGKLAALVAQRRPAPPDVLLDKDGRPSTNPADLFEGGTILPLGGAQGYKGYLLGFLVEVLAGLLTEGGYPGNARHGRFNNCALFLVLDVAAFRPMAEFERELEDFVAYLKATRPQPGMEVLVPGEVEARTEAERRAGGIPLPEDTVAALQAELDRYGVAKMLTGLAAGTG